MAKRVSKRDTISQRTAYRGGAVLMGLPFMGIGGYFALVGFGYLPLPSKANAPLWVVGFVGLAFALAGVMVFVSGVRGVLHQRRRKRLGDRAEPWFRDYDWEAEGITDHALARPVRSLFALVFFVVFLLPFNWWAFASGHGPWMVKGIVGLFNLILLLVAGTCLYQLAQFLKYGHSRLRFKRFPFFVGGPLEAVFSPNRFDKLTFTLRFIEEKFVTTGSGRNRSRQQVNYEHFSTQQTIEPHPTDAEVDVAFDVPDNPEWQTAISEQPVRYWELLVEAEAPGVDFKTTFPLPVYARAHKREEVLACTP